MIEIGLGTMVLALAMMPALGLIRTNVKGTAQSLHLTRALQTARAALDAAQVLGHDELTDAAMAAVVATVPVPEGVQRPRVDPLEVTQERLSDGTFYSAKVMTVRVKWRSADGSGGEEEVVLRGLSVFAH